MEGGEVNYSVARSKTVDSKGVVGKATCSTGARGEDLPFERKLLGILSVFYLQQTPPKLPFHYLGTLMLKVVLLVQPWYAIWLHTGYERLPNTLEVFGNNAYIKPLYVIQVLSISSPAPSPLINCQETLLKIFRNNSEHDNRSNLLVCNDAIWGSQLSFVQNCFMYPWKIQYHKRD